MVFIFADWFEYFKIAYSCRKKGTYGDEIHKSLMLLLMIYWKYL